MRRILMLLAVVAVASFVLFSSVVSQAEEMLYEGYSMLDRPSGYIIEALGTNGLPEEGGALKVSTFIKKDGVEIQVKFKNLNKEVQQKIRWLVKYNIENNFTVKKVIIDPSFWATQSAVPTKL